MMPSPTANKRVLIATQGFAALGLITPDFVVPNGFLPTNGGTLDYAGVETFTFSSLPTDGVTAINRNGVTIHNVATNFAGQTASVAATAAPAAIVPLAGVWWNPNESGSGFGLDYQNGTLIVEVYSYLAGGASQWYLAAGPLSQQRVHGDARQVHGRPVHLAARTPRPRSRATTARSRSRSHRRRRPPSICRAAGTSRSSATSSPLP